MHYLNQGSDFTKGALAKHGSLSPLPFDYGLEQNYPNPFNPTTVIKYAVPKAGLVTLRIFNIAGQEVTTLLQKQQAAGRYQVSWDGRDFRGQPVAAGLYFYRLEVRDFNQVKRMVLLK
ncbi:MAG: FlgD immunoglobulin-like domain containing protein [bacterium]